VTEEVEVVCARSPVREKLIRCPVRPLKPGTGQVEQFPDMFLLPGGELGVELSDRFFIKVPFRGETRIEDVVFNEKVTIL